MPAHSDNAMSLPLGSLIDRKYRLDAVLGQGSFGITYRAMNTALNRPVAIKECVPMDFAWREGTTVIPRGASYKPDFEWALATFIAEAKTLAQFDHPAIVKVHDIFEENGTAYMVMRYEPGWTLDKYLKAMERNLTEDEVKSVLFQLLEGLGQVHERKYLHRDIKPENIYITESGQPLLLDFGSARHNVSNRSRPMTAVLTPGYAPLEQYHDDGNQGAWSDIYALAGCIHFMLTGEAPPEATKRLSPKKPDPYRPLAELFRGKFGDAFLKAIDVALSVEEGDRPQDVWQFVEMLSTQRTEGVPRVQEVAPTRERKVLLQEGSPYLVASLGLELLWVNGGTFVMGSSSNETNRYNDETEHKVTLSQGYWLGKYAVTQEQWKIPMGTNPSHFKGYQLPVETVSWKDVMFFCQQLTELERQAGRLLAGCAYTLPTEAQWEYACRAGTTGEYGGTGSLDSMGWYGSNSEQKTHPVGQKQANAWGFYDMRGNVWEWCYDQYGNYPAGHVIDPTGASTGSNNVFRGGGWSDDARICRSASRGNGMPVNRFMNLGFRLCLAPVRQ